MMKKTGRMMLFAVMIALLLIPVRAQETPAVRVQNATAVAGGTARVDILLENTPGAVCLSVRVDYDPASLTLTDVIDGGILGKSVFPPDAGVRPYQLNWENDLARADFTQNGVLATLVFAVSPDAQPGDVPVSLTVVPGSSFNADLEERAFTAVGGTVTILSSASGTAIAPLTDEPSATAADTPAAQTPETTTAAPEMNTPEPEPITSAIPTKATPAPEQKESSFLLRGGLILLAALCAAAVAAVLIFRKKHD